MLSRGLVASRPISPSRYGMKRFFAYPVKQLCLTGYRARCRPLPYCGITELTSLSKTAALLAMVGLALTPASAQAGTRAQSSPVEIDIQRRAPDAGDTNAAGQFNLIWLLLLLAVIAALVGTLSGGRTRGG